NGGPGVSSRAAFSSAHACTAAASATRTGSAAALILAVLLALPGRASAQTIDDPLKTDEPVRSALTHLPLIRDLPDAVPGSCPAVPATADTPVPDETERAEAERLGTEASNAAILGDLATARDLLARVAALDPWSPTLVFRLARTHEDLSEDVQAVSEYC